MTIQELEQCFGSVLEMLRSRGIQSVETGQRDLYWKILLGDWLDFEDEAKPAVGSLDDDMQALKFLLLDNSGASLLDLERLTAVMLLIAEDLRK